MNLQGPYLFGSLDKAPVVLLSARHAIHGAWFREACKLPGAHRGGTGKPDIATSRMSERRGEF